MSTKEVTSESEFKTLIGENSVCAVDFYADWCGPCKMISPVFHQLAGQYPDVLFLSVNVDSQQAISSAAGIRAMPTFQFYVKGAMVEEFSGADVSKLKQLVQKYASNAEPAVKAFSGQGRTLGASGGGLSGIGIQQEIIDTLVDMGYPKRKAELTAEKSRASSIEEAIGWLESNEYLLEETQYAEAVTSSLPEPQIDAPSEEKREVTEKYLRQKMEEARKIKEEEEKKNSQMKEIKRRQQGQDIRSSREKWKEIERQKDAEARKKEKREEREAKRMILERIKASKQKRKVEQPQVPMYAEEQEVVETFGIPEVQGDKCNVQLRLPDGSTIRETFGNEETLKDMRQFVYDRYPALNQAELAFVTVFPRRTFSYGSFNTTLLELGLHPNGTLIVQVE